MDNITEKIKSFEDACQALCLEPTLPVVAGCSAKDRKSIIAYYKLSIIIRALNEGWEPNWSDWTECKYYNWFYLDSAGLAYASTSYAVTHSSASVGSRLGFKTRALAEYAREQFKDLYVDYLFLPCHE